MEQQLEWRKRPCYVSTVPPIEAESPGTASDTGNQVYETCYDEATGRWYYVNVTTGHSMWADEWSDMSVGQSSSRGEVSAATETPQSLSASQCWPMSPPAPLGTPESNEWETHFDTNSQQYYYVNQVTGDSMWADALLHATVTDSHHTGKVATVMMNYDAISSDIHACCGPPAHGRCYLTQPRDAITT